jgi:hypothetical protein
MSRKTLGGIIAIIGAILIVAGLALMLVVVPGMKQFPEDVDTTRAYTGTMPVLLNPATFEFMTDLDVDLSRHFRTEEVDGDAALVFEEQILLAGGQPLQQLVKHYAIDRKSMEVTDSYPEEWASNEGFWPREGLVLGWPIDTDKKDYVGWSDDYRDTVTLAFSEEVQHDRSGVTTYYFTASSPAQPIHPDAVTAMGLPNTLPKEQFAGLIQGADVSDALKNMIPVLLDQWEEDTIPLQYYYEYEAEYWIEPETGVLIDTRKHELRKVGLGEEFLQMSPLLANMSEEQRAGSRVTVFDLTYQATDDAVQDAKQDAEDASGQIELFGTTIPIAAIIIGALLIVAGGVLVLSKAPTAD